MDDYYEAYLKEQSKAKEHRKVLIDLYFQVTDYMLDDFRSMTVDMNQLRTTLNEAKRLIKKGE